MITSAYISILRRAFTDVPRLHYDTQVGDGSSTVYNTKFKPIKESTVTVKIDNAVKAEGVAADYTFDYDTGDLIFSSAPSGTKAVDIIYKSVNFRDAHWLDAIQHAHQAMGDQFYRVTLMSTSGITLATGVKKYDCPSNCIRLLKVFESSNYTSGGVYVPMTTNWEYDRRANQLILGQAPTRANFTAISYQRKVVAPSAVTMALDIEENWQSIIHHKAGAYYLRAQADRIAQQGNATIEEGHLSTSVLRAMANDHEAQFEIIRKRVKPVMPNLEIPFWDPSGGYPNR